MRIRVVTIAAACALVITGIGMGSPVAASELARAAISGLGFVPVNPLPGGSLSISGEGCAAGESVLVRTWVPAIGSASYHDVTVATELDGSFTAPTDVYGAPGDVPPVAAGDQFGVAVFCGGVPTADPERTDVVFGTFGGLNSVPMAIGDTFTTPYESALEVPAPGLLANDTDADGDPVTAREFTGPSNGTLTNFLGDGSFRYTPDPGFSGTDSFVYYAWDGVAASADVTVTIEVGAAPAPGTPTATLADTGSPAISAILGALCLLVLGAVALRRSRATS